MTTTPLRVANCSGFFGDRLSAAREMVDDGPIDVLTGDWLAELTMGVLLKQRHRDPAAGYARTFLTQLEDVLADCLERGIRIVSNAGGLNPRACAAKVEQIASDLGRTVRVAVVDGDDATELVRRARDDGWTAPHLDTGEPFDELAVEVEVASAYLGCWGIAEALQEGADIVITGRVSDASVIVGPAAWHFGWVRDEWDALAGAVAAGHVIECGAQATGGNFSFFSEVPALERPGFPLAEIAADGSAVITKHPGTGGAVTVETVTAQLLYEIDGPRYLNPDVIARFDTLTLEQEGPDRVRISGTRGEPAPDTLKVGLITTPGHRNSVTFVITGDEVPAKADLAQRALWAAIPGGDKAFDEVHVRLLRADRPDPGAPDEATALLTVSVSSRDRSSVAQLARAAVETGLSSYPGFHLTAPPSGGSAYTVFWPTLLPHADSSQTVSFEGREWTAAPPPTRPAPPAPPTAAPSSVRSPAGPTVRSSLGTVLGSRSGDKGGNATLGVWARDDRTYDWLTGWLTEDRWRELLPQAGGLALRPWWMPNLRAAGVTVVGLLGRGVGANLHLDSQGKGLGEYLRARHVELPAALLETPGAV
ncbi:acyclic terpene utilization AtuA family protein [Actinomycetospora sp. NBC_00405]|uniref:acyclic terpene utilization AtuA family protein n=1 Tax=Actinomycetospora sp. NBC_00405 TaxID=2975952 RepID=UPI002E20DE1D